MLLAAAIPKIDLVISLVGAISGTFLVIEKKFLFKYWKFIKMRTNGDKYFTGTYFSTITWVYYLRAKHQQINPYQRNPDPHLRGYRLHHWNLRGHFSHRSRIHRLIIESSWVTRNPWHKPLIYFFFVYWKNNSDAPSFGFALCPICFEDKWR